MRFLCVLLVLLSACKPATTTIAQNDNALQKLVTHEIGENAIITQNESKTFAVGILSKDESTRYVVIRLSDNKVVIKNSIRGSIAWTNDMQLSESVKPGIVKKDSKPGDYSRTIDLNQFLMQAK